jgi:hypothetical protein
LRSDRQRVKIMPDHEEQSQYSSDNCGFEGKYEFDLTVEMLGRRITRRARVLYEHTPLWPYFDRKKNGLCVADIPETMLSLEILAMPREFHEDGTVTDKAPYWVEANEILDDDLFPDLTDALCDAIDDRCKSEDEERRREHKTGGDTNGSPPRAGGDRRARPIVALRRQWVR